MKHKINVIKINGIKGIFYALFMVVCLAAGFVWFPGYVCMKLWNLSAAHLEQIPYISIFQGLLLWGIIAASYFTFRKDRLVVCMRANEGLSEEELREVFSDIKQNYQHNSVIQSMIKARETELKIKNLSDNIPETKIDLNTERREKQLNNK